MQAQLQIGRCTRERVHHTVAKALAPAGIVVLPDVLTVFPEAADVPFSFPRRSLSFIPVRSFTPQRMYSMVCSTMKVCLLVALYTSKGTSHQETTSSHLRSAG